ncbi:ran GTPase-activating protein 1 isoform X1 [Lingula anatina]|uniref:Ran GTPase-activating protein 1 isoform X1 n=1 Tax=Lingula anatina TaxID=7574 RepID=A0A1S3IXJ3_LINAN|nr:ran GTPase-activating protein 1 isoform X1 [Lingula anatina]|eukprot:XP_013402920.1 ran GTPase-activating protein 1 isoform X1 [Lingula anatina]
MMAGADLNQLTDRLAKASVEESSILSFAGQGRKLDTEDDAKEIADAIVQFKSMKALRMDGNTLGVDAAKAISKGLEKHPEFERALWSDMFTGRLKTEIPQALMYLSNGIMLAGAKLVELDLSDNAFGPHGINGVVELLKSESCYTLKELRLNNNGLGVTGGKILAKTLLECSKASSAAGAPLALRVFFSGRGRLENEGSIALAEAFKIMGSLEEVQMPQNGINHEGITALAEAFTVNKNLRIINLNDNTFTEVGAKSMAKALKHVQNLEVINFGDCLIRSGGARVLAAALQEGHKKLKELVLSFNEINKDAANEVAECVENKECLEKLDLNGNQLGEEGVELIQGTLEAMGRLDCLASLSDDEGDDEDEDDEEGDASRQEEEEEEDDDEGLEICDPNLQVKGTAISPRPEDMKPVSVTEFLQLPTAPKLISLGSDRTAKIMTEIEKDFNNTDKCIQTLMKISCVVSSENTKAQNAVNEIADSLLGKLLRGTDESTKATISNSILVHIGLLKSEDKVKPVADPSGPMLVLSHVVKQSYFPKLARDILQVFFGRPHERLDKCQQSKHLLLQSLYQV